MIQLLMSSAVGFPMSNFDLALAGLSVLLANDVVCVEHLYCGDNSPKLSMESIVVS